jgi:hypothetical protein
LKAIAFSLRQTYPEMQVILLDFHGDQEIVGETCYPIHMASPHGINPLVVNLDPEVGEIGITLSVNSQQSSVISEGESVTVNSHSSSVISDREKHKSK